MLGTTTALVFCLGGLGADQDDRAQLPAPSAESVARLEELDIEIEDYEFAWRKEQRALHEANAEEVEKAKVEGREPVVAATAMVPDFSRFIATLKEWADGSEGEDQALYLTRICTLDMYESDGEGGQALGRLLEHHAASPSWARLGPMLGYFEYRFGGEFEGGIAGRLAANPSPDVRGWVALTVHSDVIGEAPLDSEAYRAARDAVTAVAGEVTDEGLRDQLIGVIEVREKLGVGVKAPDIVGLDLDGVAFKLSDYEGRIVFLDFWGDW
ncbi:MAG: hypothetical protein QF903_08115 [Planctomycetota bacterium]|jgi:hypothetical protein|nr:hypothetical protein [Planctomycetota bacterium]MDP6761467.1 hypothetical protein [Planctomycetota bacterium]MDP6989429.1 hypothetical protein [Planctomycetota bacterium]